MLPAPSTSVSPSTTTTIPPPTEQEGDVRACHDLKPLPNIPAAVLAHGSHGPSPLLQDNDPTRPNQSTSYHRRANTEVIIRRQAPLPARQLFPDQPKTYEDLDRRSPGTENIARRTLEEGAKRLSGWFQGKSEPVNLGVVYQPSETDAASTRGGLAMDPPGTPMSRAQKRMTAPSPLKQVTSSSPFSFFGLKRLDNKMDLPEPAEDEFLNLDINAALFPPGSNDLSGQAAFDALRNNADNILRQLQAAYKQRTFALHETLADKSEKQEELEETRTRVGHLKIQLDGMAEKVLQQEKAMKAMAEELEQERQLRRREDEARRRSVMLVRSSDDESISDAGPELRTPKRSLKRASNATFTSGDSGFESGDESLAESIFSRREGLESPASTVAPSPNISQIALSTPTSTAQPSSQKELKPAGTPTPRPSTYDRVIKGLASTGIGGSWVGSSAKCSICHGVPSSEAWSVMGILKEENKGLKSRLGELELVIDDCLSMVGP
ncbi:transport protein SEC61 subunit alpha [Aspergillus terreus]|uniref:Transport protein SEC61 subunit alpha n=1 Tax=Aspergillus terreus TaxID=33178 RepID=A0A5M3ZEI5_ASPTE|nr:hypothetical protein ATETN484_0013029600 [Aspergillus terreus]GFF20530.1 transport protein SEC61 subunit alpha [Aspergillus terreus]